MLPPSQDRLGCAVGTNSAKLAVAYAVQVASCSGYQSIMHWQEDPAPCQPTAGVQAAGAFSIWNVVGQGGRGKGA